MEAQERFLERITEEHRNRSPATITKPANSSKPYSSMSLPSLCEESESNNGKESDLSDDSEADKSEEDQEFRALKRFRVEGEEEFIPPRFMKSASYNLQLFQNQSMLLSPYPPAQEMINCFPWNVAASCPSPLMPSFM